MNNPRTSLRQQNLRLAFVALLVLALLPAAAFWSSFEVSANHPVLVEGERDYDGDGLTGVAEDNDNANDRIFGTVTAALGAANGGANQNGRVVIVTSGRFHEQLNITNANGNTTVEAAPGVEATIDAVATGDRAGQFPASNNATRQGQPGVIVNSPANRYATLRNLVIRNWTDGIQVQGTSRVAIDNCRLEGNVNHGIQVLGSSRVTITNSQIQSTGFRVGATGSFPSDANQPNPGIGIAYRNTSSGTIMSTTVSGSFAIGVANFTGNFYGVRVLLVNSFDNGGSDFLGIKPIKGTVPGAESLFP
ncbi:MAG TPA: right-handed parallel beta-helix repeat-containing protein [Blastocatellia bacterium]|nr:right-handed parallel beta-helix repeat-containing protein [Blastocatellia bacterium]